MSESLEGDSVSALFSREELKTRYEDALEHYTDVGGVIDDGTRYFGPEHPTIAALQDSSESLPNNDVGIFTDRDLVFGTNDGTTVEMRLPLAE